jgi:hypothetical protein
VRRLVGVGWGSGPLGKTHPGGRPPWPEPGDGHFIPPQVEGRLTARCRARGARPPRGVTFEVLDGGETADASAGLPAARRRDLVAERRRRYRCSRL